MRKIRYKRVLCNPKDGSQVELDPTSKPKDALEIASMYMKANNLTDYWSWWDFESEEVPEEWE